VQAAIHGRAALHADAHAAERSPLRPAHGDPAWFTGHHHRGSHAGTLVHEYRFAVDGDRELGNGASLQSVFLSPRGSAASNSEFNDIDSPQVKAGVGWVE